jgi:hypothetical protein
MKGIHREERKRKERGWIGETSREAERLQEIACEI